MSCITHVYNPSAYTQTDPRINATSPLHFVPSKEEAKGVGGFMNVRLRYQNCNIDDDALSVATNLSYSLGPSWSNLCNVLN